MTDRLVPQYPAITGAQLKANHMIQLADAAERDGRWTADMRLEDKAEYNHDLQTYITTLRAQARQLRSN